MERSPRSKMIAKLVAKAWSDEDFKRRLVSEPAKVFKEEGIEVPAGTELVVVEDGPKRMHFVLPVCPDELKEETMDVVGQNSCDTITDFHCGGGCNPLPRPN